MKKKIESTAIKNTVNLKRDLLTNITKYLENQKELPLYVNSDELTKIKITKTHFEVYQQNSSGWYLTKMYLKEDIRILAQWILERICY